MYIDGKLKKFQVEYDTRYVFNWDEDEHGG